MKSVPLSGSGTIQTDSIERHRFDEGRMAAVVRAAGGVLGGRGRDRRIGARCITGAGERFGRSGHLEQLGENGTSKHRPQRCSRMRTLAIRIVAGSCVASYARALRTLNATSAARSFALCRQQS